MKNRQKKKLLIACDQFLKEKSPEKKKKSTYSLFLQQKKKKRVYDCYQKLARTPLLIVRGCPEKRARGYPVVEKKKNSIQTVTVVQ